MIRTKVTLVYIVFVILMGSLAVALLHMDMSAALKDDTRTALRRSANVAEQSIRLDEASLLAKAQFVAQGEALHAAMKGEAAEEGEEAEQDAQLSFVEKRHLAAHEKLGAQRYRLDDIAKAVAKRRNLELGPLERKPHDIDIFVALDVKGEGVAALGKDLYSWFGEDVAKTYPSVREVAKSGVPRIEYWWWSFGQNQDKRPYRVAIAPIRKSESDSTVGVVVLGTMLNDGVAQAKQRLIVGVSDDDKSADVSSAPQFVMYRGKAIVASTFDSAQQNAVSAELDRVGGFTADSSTILDVEVAGVPYMAMVRQFGGEGDKAVGVAVLANVAAAVAPVQGTTTTMLLIFIAFALLGAGLIFVLILRWIQPVEDVEAGIQEVIAGNRDYVWQPISGHALQTSLAQSLNLMSAFLQGKPMPDDDSPGGSWGADMDEVSTNGGEAPRIQGVALPLMQAPPPKKED